MSFKSLNIQDSIEAIKKGAIIIDVREQSEHDQAHIQNSFLLPLSTVSAEKVRKINSKNKTIIIHCRSGKRSKVAANILLKQDYTGEILEIDEGIIGWIENNQPIISNS